MTRMSQNTFRDNIVGFVTNPDHSLFTFPALNEGDFLTLLAFEKYNIVNYVSFSYIRITDFSIEEVIGRITVAMKWALASVNSFTNYSVYVFIDEEQVEHLLCLHKSRDTEQFTKLHFQLYTPFKGSTAIDAKFDNIIIATEVDTPKVTWVTSTNQGICTNVLAASKNRPIKDCFYPYIPEGVDKFYTDYDKSDSPILILLGPPGTGKTSLIRNYMYKRNKKALISYDHRLMSSDEFFLFFLENEYDLLILEDYDNFLKSKKEEEENILDKFLNLSSGLVDISKKKIIFTGNVDATAIDTALVRPGRCWRVLESDLLTDRQVEQVIKEAGLSEDTLCEDDMSLAEIFNSQKGSNGKRKIGF